MKYDLKQQKLNLVFCVQYVQVLGTCNILALMIYRTKNSSQNSH